MGYPTLNAVAADRVAETLGQTIEESQREEHVVVVQGVDHPVAVIDAAATRAKSDWHAEVLAREGRGESADIFLLEAFMASRLHRTLQDLPMDLLQDFGYWRYLALFPYRWYLQLREGGATETDVKPQDFGGTSEKKDNPAQRVQASSTYHVLLRTFLWGKAAFDAGEPDPYRRTTLVNETGGAVTDVWHSHIVRIQLGQLGRLPHAFLDSICDDPKANGVHDGRAVEKRLTRMKHSVLFDTYGLDEARALVDAEKSIALSKLAGGDRPGADT